MLNTYSDSISTTDEATTPVPSVVSTKKMESVASFILLFTVILSPLAFLPSAYIALDTVKTVLIALGVLLSAILFGIIAYKEKKVSLPPRAIVWSSILVVVSLIVSSLLSTHFMKSFFGQGFELGTSSFILILLLAGLVTYVAVQRRI